MASPFKFFRKYSSGMMIIMVILSMLLFTLTDLFSDPGESLWLLGLILGGTVFGIAGLGQGRWLQWGIGGAVLGVVMGLILPGFVEGNGLATSLGVISEDEMYDLEIRRSIANRVMFQSTEASFGPGTGRFASLFGFGHNSNREDVIFGKIMRAEADRLGITVDKDMVSKYLLRRTGEKLTTTDYVEIRNNLTYNRKPLNDELLNEIMGDEIKAQMAYQTLRPRTTVLPPGPEVYWQYFRRLKVRQQLNTASLAVDDFLNEVGEPSETEVNQLFAQYRTKFPNQVEPGSPGFRLPFRARLAYVELDSDSVEAEVGEVTDADVEKYYADNKENSLIRRPVLPDAELQEMPDESPKTDDTKTDEVPKTDDTKTDDTKTDDTKTDDTKTDEKPPADPKPGTTTPAPKTTEDPATPPAKKAADDKEASPAKEAPADKAPETAPPEADVPEGAKDTPATESEAKESPEPETTDEPEPSPAEEPGDSCDPIAPDEETSADESTPAADEPASEPAKTDEPKVDEPKPVDEPQGEKPTKAAATDAPADPPAATADADPVPANAADEKTDPKATTNPPSLTIPDVPDEPQITPKKTPEIQYEYRELNDELKTEIREEILRQRVKEAVDKKMTALKIQMDSLASQRSTHRFETEDPTKFDGRPEEQLKALRELREQMKPFEDELGAKLKKYAEDNGMAYVQTPLISYAEFVEADDYPIASATEPNDNPMLAAQSANVAVTMFQSFNNDEQNNDAQMFIARRAQRSTLNLDSGQSHFAYWATDFSVQHIPKLDEDGVREMVVLAWKRMKARELVVKRGEELAQKVRDALAKEGEDRQDMAAVLKDETTTGNADGSAIAVRKTDPFSWLKTSSAAPMSFQQQQASLSTIQFQDGTGGVLPRVGDPFMKAVFEDLDDEEVGVVPNGDRSRYYVVHVTNRFPTPEVGESGLREQFAAEGKMEFGRSPILGVMQQQLEGPTSLAWERSVWQRYGVSLDDEPEAE